MAYFGSKHHIRHLTSVPQYNKLTNSGLIVKGEAVVSSVSALSSRRKVRNPSNAAYQKILHPSREVFLFSYRVRIQLNVTCNKIYNYKIRTKWKNS
jgi:hypothetical protein